MNRKISDSTSTSTSTAPEDAAPRRVPTDAEYEHAYRVIARVRLAASSPLNCLAVVEAYILVGLGHLVAGFLRAVDEYRRFAEDAGEPVSA